MGDGEWSEGVNLNGENGNISAGIWGIYRLAGCENPQTRHPVGQAEGSPHLQYLQ